MIGCSYPRRCRSRPILTACAACCLMFVSRSSLLMSDSMGPVEGIRGNSGQSGVGGRVPPRRSPPAAPVGALRAPPWVVLFPPVVRMLGGSTIPPPCQSCQRFTVHGALLGGAEGCFPDPYPSSGVGFGESTSTVTTPVFTLCRVVSPAACPCRQPPRPQLGTCPPASVTVAALPTGPPNPRHQGTVRPANTTPSFGILSASSAWVTAVIGYCYFPSHRGTSPH